MSNGSFSQAGFYYQNNVAALKILGLLDLNSDLIDVSLENYHKGEHIDDIIITKKDHIEFYQVKWSHEITNSFTINNLVYQLAEDSDKSLWRKLADGYTSIITGGKKATIILYSTRQAGNSKLQAKGFNKGLKDLIAFQNKFRKSTNTQLDEAEKYNEFKTILDKLKAESGLSDKNFFDFFKTLQFDLGAPELEYIKQQLQNKADKLGFEDTQITKLLDLVVQWSISGVTITRDKLLLDLGIKDRFVDRLSQIFKVDDGSYVENTELFKQLDTLLSAVNSGYVFIEGVPGAGKSTSLTKYALQNKEIRFSYYCFIPEDTTTRDSRLKGEYFLKSVCIAIEKSFPDVDLPIKYSDNYEDKLSQYLDKISTLGEKIIFLIDGLDHVHRNKEVLNNPLTNNVLSALPDNLIIILSSQYIDALPPNVKAEILGDPQRHIKISRFSEIQVRSYLTKKSLSLRDEEILLVFEKSEGIPLYLRYITSLLEETDPAQYPLIINEFPGLVNSEINTYHEILFQKIESNITAQWILSLLANRKEYTGVEVLKAILKIAGVTFDSLGISINLKSFKHLLKEKEGEYYTIFHNSFREFIIRNTQQIREQLNAALIAYYENDLFEDEAYRNYFSHLFYLKKYDTIIKTVNEAWINESWSRYQPLTALLDNIKIAWNSCVQIKSLSEFVRIAFLKHQLELTKFNLSSGNFEEAIYFLDAGLNRESLRSVWDGEFPLTENEDFFNYYAVEYFTQTGNAIPFSVAAQFFTTFLSKATLEKDPRTMHERENDFGAYFKARSLYLSPAELVEEIRSLLAHVKIDDLKSLIEFLNKNGKLAHLLELWKTFKKGGMKNYALSELLLGLYAQQSSDIKIYESKFSFDELEQKDKINFLEKIITYLPEEEFLKRYRHINIEPFYDEEIISTEHDYPLKEEFIDLLKTLKVYYLLNETNYSSFDIKLSALPDYPRVLYFAISSCARIWILQKKGNTGISLIGEFKKVIDYLTIPRYQASLIQSEHGARSFIKYHIYKINEVVFGLINEICPDDILKQLIPYWIESHDRNGFPDYKSDLVFAKTIINRKNLKDEIYSLINHSETLARGDHDTYSLVESLAKIGSSYGKHKYMEDYNRIYQELLAISCGVAHRKDYQFADIFSVLEKAHQVNENSTLKRLADNYYLLFKIKDAGNPRMLHICLSTLIGFTMKYYPGLAFHLLNREDEFLGRDEAIDIVLSKIIPGCPDSNVPYIWSIIKTLNKWEDFGRDNDSNLFSLYDEFFNRLVTYPDIVFVEECYKYLFRQFTVEQNIPLSILKINKILAGSNYTYNFIEVPAVKNAKENLTGSSVVMPAPRNKEKFTKKAVKLDFKSLRELASNNLEEIENYILSHEENFKFRQLSPLISDLYKSIIDKLKDWYDNLPGDSKSVVRKAALKSKRAFLDTRDQIAKLNKPGKQVILKSVKQLISTIQDMLPGTNFLSFIETNIDLQKLVKQIYQDTVIRNFDIKSVISEEELFDLLGEVRLDQVAKWEYLIDKYFHKSIGVQAYLKLSKRVFVYDRDLARKFLGKAFQLSNTISYKEHDENELIEWAYSSSPENANYYLLNNFYSEYVERSGELMYHLSKKLVPWSGHFNEPDFYEVYYDANYTYNIKLAEGLPEPEIDASFITNHKENSKFEILAINYLVDLLDYPVVKIRHLAIDSLCNLYKVNQDLFHEYILENLTKKSSNQVEHFLTLIHSLSIKYANEIGQVVSKIEWLFESGHYNIQESYADLIKYNLEKGSPISDNLINTAISIHSSPLFPIQGIIRPLINSKTPISPYQYQNSLIKQIAESEIYENSFAAELNTLLIEEADAKENSKDAEGAVFRRFNSHPHFGRIEVKGPLYNNYQDKINRLFFKHILQGRFEDGDIRKLKYEFRVYDPTEPFSQRTSRPEYIFWKGKTIDENGFMKFEDVDELINSFLDRQEHFITLFERGYQEIYEHPHGFSQHFEISLFLTDHNISLEELEDTLKEYNSYFHNINLYRSEIVNHFKVIDKSDKINDIIYPLVGVSDKYFRHEMEDSIAVLLPHISAALSLSQVSESLNFTDENTISMVEFIEWQDPYMDHGTKRFEPVSKGCTLNINKSMFKEYLAQQGLSLNIHLTFRRSVDKHIPEPGMKWLNKFFVRKIKL